MRRVAPMWHLLARCEVVAPISDSLLKAGTEFGWGAVVDQC